MSREIKFRAWDKDNKEMFEPVIPFGDSVYKTVVIDIEEDKSYLAKFENAEIMQNTGLKDKNRKEIYAGDICRWRDSETFDDEILEDIFVIVWNDEKLAWYTQNEDGNFADELYAYTDERDLEVIGNIYENADLLEVEE